MRTGVACASACSLPTMDRYFCLIILLVAFYPSCRSGRPRPDATEQERSRSLDVMRLPLRMVRAFLSIEGLRTFSRFGSTGRPSITPPKRTSFGNSGHSDCLLNSVLISYSRLSFSHSGSTGALSITAITAGRPPYLLPLPLLSILCGRTDSLQGG